MVLHFPVEENIPLKAITRNKISKSYGLDHSAVAKQFIDLFPNVEISFELVN